MLTRKEFLRVGAFGVVGAFLVSPLKAQATGAKRTWIMAAETFDAALGRDPELAQAMSGEICHVLGKGPSYGATRIRSYCLRDYRKIRGLIDLGRLGEGETIVYAIENGNGIDSDKQTPIYQQIDLEGSIKAATSLCHSVGATLIAAPASSILVNIDPESTTNRLEAMLRNRIPETCALYADAYDIQAQQSLQNVQKYATYVKGCAAQARAAAPEKPILAGLTTNSLRREPDDYPAAREMYAAAEAVRGVVQGYWLNVPPHRTTGVRNYRKARRFLQMFYGLSST
jgi:hypothetical protein